LQVEKKNRHVHDKNQKKEITEVSVDWLPHVNILSPH
jgi:hypothetical protein